MCASTGRLSKIVFERRMLTGSEAFVTLKGVDATKCVFVSVFTIKEAILPKN